MDAYPNSVSPQCCIQRYLNPYLSINFSCALKTGLKKPYMLRENHRGPQLLRETSLQNNFPTKYRKNKHRRPSHPNNHWRHTFRGKRDFYPVPMSHSRGAQPVTTDCTWQQYNLSLGLPAVSPQCRKVNRSSVSSSL